MDRSGLLYRNVGVYHCVRTLKLGVWDPKSDSRVLLHPACLYYFLLFIEQLDSLGLLFGSTSANLANAAHRIKLTYGVFIISGALFFRVYHSFFLERYAKGIPS